MDQMREWMVERFGRLLGDDCESPMESLFWAGWMCMRPHSMLTSDACLKEERQAEIGKYRADFLFTVKDEKGATQRLVVEVDGHDYHERTKQQAAHDKARDRWMTGEKYQVMRFTGSEVYANPMKCAAEVAERLYLLRHGGSRKDAIAKAGLAAIRALIEG